MRWLALLVAVGCSSAHDTHMHISTEMTVDEQEASARALERWEAATGAELYEPVINDSGLFRVVIGNDYDAEIGLGRHRWNRITIYRGPVEKHARYADGYNAMFEAVVVHEIGHQLGADHVDTGGIMGVGYVPPKEWRLCINPLDLYLVCQRRACLRREPECSVEGDSVDQSKRDRD